jgi:WD40 repeat protein
MTYEPRKRTTSNLYIDFKIRIWNCKNILETESDRLLSTLGMHDGAVLTVRWSIDGEYLASGSDDQKIIIWKLDEYGDQRANRAEQESEPLLGR